ncbi:MAG: endonuclease/exonuclease/phosphatase family protein [Deltaproteobacteria bacterium]|nr:endonuclease/exonuclease/phosphatase family protein [Deltaproteobacteria bacterium]
MTHYAGVTRRRVPLPGTLAFAALALACGSADSGGGDGGGAGGGAGRIVDGGGADAGGGGDAGADAGTPGVSVVTYNILHGLGNEDPPAGEYDGFGDRLPIIAAELARRRPDVVMLQEVFAGGGDGYPDVIKTLRAAMNSGAGDRYTVIFGPINGQPPTKNSGSAFGQITMTRLPIVSYANYSVVEVEEMSPRSVLHARITAGGRDVDFFNAHLQGPDDPTAAATEMNDVLAFIDATSVPGGIAVLGGDLNSPDSAPLYDVLRAAEFSEAGAMAGLICTPANNSGCTNSTIPLREPGNRTSKRLDYVFLRGAALDPAGCGLVFAEPVNLDGGVLWPSDHIGMGVWLVIAPQ